MNEQTNNTTLENEILSLRRELAAAKGGKRRLERSLERIGFYLAGTEHQRIADVTLKVLAGSDVEQAIAATAQEDAR